MASMGTAPAKIPTGVCSRPSDCFPLGDSSVVVAVEARLDYLDSHPLFESAVDLPPIKRKVKRQVESRCGRPPWGTISRILPQPRHEMGERTPELIRHDRFEPRAGTVSRVVTGHAAGSTITHAESSAYPAVHDNAGRRIDSQAVWRIPRQGLGSEGRLGSYQPHQIDAPMAVKGFEWLL